MYKGKSSAIERVFDNLRKNNQKAFIPFITCGFPTLGGFFSLFEALDKNGADIIEIGIPFSDPLADGPVIQTTSKIALENGINTDIVFNSIIKIRKSSDTPIAIMTYFNTIYHYGTGRFLKKAKRAGVNGLIIPDLPLEEFTSYRSYFNRVNIDNIMFASLTSSKERLSAIAREGKGFIYCVSVKGVTGIRNSISPEVIDFLKNLKEITNLPLALGFGLSNREQINQIKGYCDGVIIGSKILSLILEADSFSKGIKEVENFTSNVSNLLKS
ncbi:MAG: tryptophan synthase subunit alpha [Actinobacteria bacterium]|nr:tryptophan synthase subunit alpha [Actinomycetota bacterium]